MISSTYQQIQPNDRFGEIMQANLSVSYLLINPLFQVVLIASFLLFQQRGCTLLGINACPDLKSQEDRFLNNGFSSAWALDMAEVYRLLPPTEKQRYVSRTHMQWPP